MSFSAADPDSFDIIPPRQWAGADVTSYVMSFPGLLWRIEPARARIEFLNAHRVEALGDKTSLLLRSAEYRKAAIEDPDLPLVESFMDALGRGGPSGCVFRLRKTESRRTWLKLRCWPLPGDPRYAVGYLIEVTDSAEAIKSIIEKDSELQLMIDLAENPVLLVDFDEKTVIAQNAAASDLFLYSPDEFRRLSFADLYHQGMRGTVQKIENEVLFDKKWEGKLGFRRKTNSAFTADAALRFLVCKERRLLRVSLTHIESLGGNGEEISSGNGLCAGLTRSLTERLAGKNDIHEILGIFLQAQLPRHSFDAVMFSDIHTKKNKVFVYGAGEPFAHVEPGEMYSYEGTIAQSIERFRLDHLIVEDTLESIKAIDWALFIPKGIRSYFAKPFYQRGALRAVLVLCSREPNAFPASGLPEYSCLFEPFETAIRSWRTAQRRSRSSGG
ncbi:PAS domain-containing protein [Desulfovibrio aminophilus]|uniref:PAS domain-containing protein n=1 Tax=Desulfovibrio aminophilus TaxID=81425 RepID=UPI0033914CB4